MQGIAAFFCSPARARAVLWCAFECKVREACDPVLYTDMLTLVTSREKEICRALASAAPTLGCNGACARQSLIHVRPTRPGLMLHRTKAVASPRR